LTQENQTANIDAEMAASASLLQFLLMLVAGWLQRQQAATIDYLKAENRVLRERLGGRRIIFTDVERRRLAEKARVLERKALHELGTIITPDTLLRWHRELGAKELRARLKSNASMGQNAGQLFEAIFRAQLARSANSVWDTSAQPSIRGACSRCGLRGYSVSVQQRSGKMPGRLSGQDGFCLLHRIGGLVSGHGATSPA
jgi:hypothetical protein